MKIVGKGAFGNTVWVEFEPGRQALVDLDKESGPHPSRSPLGFPMIARDEITPCYGADGKLHDSLSSLRATYRPDGNPKGKRFIEIGNEKAPVFKRPEPSERERREDIKAAIEDIKYGRVKPPVTLND